MKWWWGWVCEGGSRKEELRREGKLWNSQRRWLWGKCDFTRKVQLPPWEGQRKVRAISVGSNNKVKSNHQHIYLVRCGIWNTNLKRQRKCSFQRWVAWRPYYLINAGHDLYLMAHWKELSGEISEITCNLSYIHGLLWSLGLAFFCTHQVYR